MYILKNAFRNVWRSKGRNILMAIIIFVIAVSLCIGLSIRQAAASARESALEGMSITAQISVDRSAMMNNAKGESDGDSDEEMHFDKSSFSGFSDSLSIDELEVYADASTVEDFYYTITSSLDGTDDIEPVTSSSSSADEASSDDSDSDDSGSNSDVPDDIGGGKMNDAGQGGGMSISGNGDFSIIGYSDDDAMTDFLDGTSTITDGSVFEAGTSDYDCIISEELATYNSVSVGDTITLANPNDEDETYDLTVVGIYSTENSSDSNGMSQMFSAADPSNEIYMSYTALKAIVDNSESVAETTTDDDGNESSTAVYSQTSGTYVFASVDDYDVFCEEVYDLGLSEDYTVSSTDVSSYEQSLVPLETLSTIAGYFLIVIIIIGTLILVVLNIFSIRERKYEIGVLTAIGMKKAKVAVQFVAEMLIVTLFAVIIGGAVGAVSSVPVANVLLESQVTSTQETSDNQQQAFGIEVGGGKVNMGDMSDAELPDDISGSADSVSSDSSAKGGINSYITEIDSAVNLTVLLELLGICVLLALIASAVSVTAIMRYDPLKILSNRD
ncbi:MAG: ABC transporter permease [Clostridiales bacterium]|nr:ABC transporter permease [Clostridiales bacterium]